MDYTSVTLAAFITSTMPETARNSCMKKIISINSLLLIISISISIGFRLKNLTFFEKLFVFYYISNLILSLINLSFR